MKSDTLTKWLTLCANLAILLGLGLVAYELNQNTQLARAAFIHEGNGVENQVWANLFGETPGEVFAKAVECPEKMTYADFFAMDAFLFSAMNMIYREYELSREGFFSSEEWKQEAGDFSRWYLGNEFGLAWWEIEGRGFFDSDFSQYIDEQLSEEGGNSYEYWQRIRDRISSTKGVEIRVSNSCIPKM